MRNSYGNTARIKYNKKSNTIEIIPTNKYYLSGISRAKNGDKECILVWEKKVNNILIISSHIDKKYSLIIKKDENILLMVQNKFIVYNCVK